MTSAGAARILPRHGPCPNCGSPDPRCRPTWPVWPTTTLVFGTNALLSLGQGLWWLFAFELVTTVLAGACWARAELSR